MGLFGVVGNYEMHKSSRPLPLWANVFRGMHLLIKVGMGAGVFFYAWWRLIDLWGWGVGLVIGWLPAAIVATLAAFTYWLLAYALFLFLLFAPVVR